MPGRTDGWSPSRMSAASVWVPISAAVRRPVRTDDARPVAHASLRTEASRVVSDMGPTAPVALAPGPAGSATGSAAAPADVGSRARREQPVRRERGLDRVRVRPDHDDDATDPARDRRGHDVRDERPARERGDELPSAEPRAAAGGQRRSPRHARLRSSGVRTRRHGRDAACAARIPLGGERGERPARRAVTGGDHLGEDRERRLFGRPAAEVQPDRTRQSARGRSSVTPATTKPCPPVRLRPPAPDRARRTGIRASSAATIAGSSNLGSWREDGDGVGRPEAHLVGDLVRPPEDESVHVGEPLGRGERGAAVDDDGLVADRPGERDERDRDLHRADDDQPRARRERPRRRPGGSRRRPVRPRSRERPSASRSAAAAAERGVGDRVAERAERRSSRPPRRRARRRAARPRPVACGPKAGEGASAGSGIAIA